MGSGTAKTLAEYGMQPDFEGSGSPTEVARSFADRLGDGQTVLFPGAKESLRSIQKALGNSIRVVDLAVYATREMGEPLKMEPDVLVLTSPSNVRSFLKGNTLQSHQRVVAIGPSTLQELKSNGYTKGIMAWAPTEEALAETVLGLI